MSAPDMPRALNTPFCDLVGVKYPIVQTGMGWVSGPRLTAATSEAGGLGILASATLTFAELEAAIRKIKERTDKPFGVNLRSDQADVRQRVALIIQEGVRVASFAQAPNKQVIATLNDAGVVTMPTIGAPRHAEKVAEWGACAVIAQGHEGGGHTGAIPTSVLLPEVCRTVDIPVLGAGGFSDGQGLVAALAYGAAGIAMGTRFLLTQESTVPDAVKAEYIRTKLNGTVVTTAVDGHPQRVIRTEMVERLERSRGVRRWMRALRYAVAFRKLTGESFSNLFREALAMKRAQDLTWSQVTMAANAPMMTRAALVEGRPELGILPTGQIAGAIHELPAVAELMERIVAEAGTTLTALGVPGHTRAAPAITGTSTPPSPSKPEAGAAA